MILRYNQLICKHIAKFSQAKATTKALSKSAISSIANRKLLIVCICDTCNSKLWQIKIYFAIVLHIDFSIIHLYS